MASANAKTPKTLKATDAIKTYRYLRIAMIGAVFLLAASILIERIKVNCWQKSISAYYYTPVRAVFVGALIAVGFALIVIKGRTRWEDDFLNLAGMLAPVVAIAPTTDVGSCWSVPPNPLPLTKDGSLAGWVVSNVHNNFYALLIAGAVGLGVATIIAVFVGRGVGRAVKRLDPGTLRSLVMTALVLLTGLVLIRFWKDFDTRAHDLSAVLMFVFLIGAVGAKALEHKRGPKNRYYPIYVLVGLLMAIGGIALGVSQLGGTHTVFILETYEIVLFAVFWAVQTVDNWEEEIEPN